MSPGANKRQTGTVPKTKTSRKNAVPQEMVAPTRRDLQQHLNVSIYYMHATLQQPKDLPESRSFDSIQKVRIVQFRSMWMVGFLFCFS